MSHPCCGEAERQAPRPPSETSGSARWLALAASPTFAGMGLLSAVAGGDPAAMICSAEHLSPLTGMAAMYLLMSIFHAGPWLKRLSGRSRRETAATIRQVRPASGLTEGARSR